MLLYDLIDNSDPNTIEQYTIVSSELLGQFNLPYTTVYTEAQNVVFGDINYPFYADNATLKTNFEKKFIQYYFNRPWAHETFGEFKRRLEQKLNQIMPYYELLYQSTTFEFDPLKNRTYTRTEQRAQENNSNGSSNTNSDNQNIHSDNPQTNFAGIDYASNMDRGNNKVSGSYTDTNTGRDDITEEFDGFIGGSKSEEIEKWRNLIVNLDERIIKECETLFSVFQ